MVNTRKNSKQKPAKRSSSFIRQPRNVSFTSSAVPQRRSTRNRNASDNSKSKQSDESSSLRSSIITLNKPSREKKYICEHCKFGFVTKKNFISHTTSSPSCKYVLAYCYGCKTIFHSQKALTQHLNHPSKQDCANRHRSLMMEYATTSTMPIELERDKHTSIVVQQKNMERNQLNPTAERNRHAMQSMQALMPGTFNYPGIMHNALDFNNQYDHDKSKSDNGASDFIDLGEDEGDSLSIDDCANSGSDHVNNNAAVPNNHTASNHTSEAMINRTKKVDAIREQVTWSNEITSALELEQILHKSGAPLGLFDKVMTWATENKTSLPERTLQLSRSRLYKACREKLYGNDNEKEADFKVSPNAPKIVSVKLPSHRTINVATFSFIEHLTSLLSNKELMAEENLIFERKPNDPFHVPRDEDRYGDVHHCKWWDDTIDMLINDPTKEILVPLILYLDALVVDAYGNLSLEPVTFTLGIFKRFLRHQARAWRTLGFIEDLDSLFGANHISPLMKANDYHAILSIILSDLKEIQKAGGIDWEFEIEGKKYKRRLKIPIMFIIGDCKGHDVLCGRQASHQAHHLCRDCNCTQESGDDPFVQCTFHKQSEIEKLSESECKAISFRKLTLNAFFDACFGANPYGINIATPPEALHAILLGICIRLVESLISELPKKAQEELDQLVGRIAMKFHRQSDREMPDLKPFKSGLSNTSRLTAKQKYARVFIIYLALKHNSIAKYITTTKFALGDTKKGHKCQFPQSKYQKTIKIFEEVLLFYRWVVKADHKKSDFEHGPYSRAALRLRQFAKDYKSAAPRHTGLKLKIPKFHQILHWWFYIALFGSAMNFDSGRTESMAGENAKDHGKNTQKRSKNFNEQTAHRLHEKTIFDEARYLAGVDVSDEVPVDETELTELELLTREIRENPNPKTDGNFERRGSTFKFFIDYGDRDNQDPVEFSAEPTGHEVVWKTSTGSTGNFLNEIMSTIARKIGLINRANNRSVITSIEGFTDLLIPVDESSPDGSKHLYRAHPGYYDGQPWHDWANIAWSKPDPTNGNRLRRYTSEGKLHLFLDFNSVTRVARLPRLHDDLPYSEIDANLVGYQALVSSVVDFSTDATPAWMKTRLAKRLPVCNTLDFVSVENIISPAFVIEDVLDKETSLPKEITSYINMTKWGEMFLSEDWNEEEIGQSQLTHMKISETSDLQFLDEEDDTDAIFLDGPLEYI